jgi:hypothetical protein
MHAAIAVAAALSVAACAYEPGTFRFANRSPAETRATIGCLDLAVSARPAPPPIVAYAFGNRCDHPVVVDLTARPIARAVDGAAYVLAAFDPDEELRPAQLDGRARGHEAIAYPTAVALAEVCVDAAAIASTTPPSWVCVPVPR